VRLASALRYHGQVSLIHSSKIIALSTDLSEPDFALRPNELEMIQVNTTHIVHCAWAVNFALPLSSFALQLASLQNLLSFALSTRTPQPAHLLFCSSIGAAMGTTPPTTIPAARLVLSQASATGYARSKLVAEHILENAVKQHGARATILRIGQVVPSRKEGSNLWNQNEAIPLVVRSATVLGVLPDRLGSGDRCSWLEADTLAKAVLDLSGIDQIDYPNDPGNDKYMPQLVYNLVNPRTFSWRDEWLPALRAAGLNFETVTHSAWLQQLAQSSSDLSKNPSRKLLQFWEEQSGNAGDMVDEMQFDTELAEKASPALRTTERVVDGDLASSLVEAWQKVW
jgi:thioester reductase-like protein